MFKINVVTPKGKSQELSCLRERCSVGKGPGNLIVLQGWKVAPKHLEFVQKDDAVYLEDKGSMEGTSVNGQRVSEYGPLRPNDEIEVGSYRLFVSIDGHSTEDTEARHQSEALKPQPAQAPHQIPASIAEKEQMKPVVPVDTRLQKWREEIHRTLLSRMDLKRLDVSSMSYDELRKSTLNMTNDIISSLQELPADINREKLAKLVADEAIGLGPLEDLLSDESVSEIMVNGHDEVFVERNGRLERSATTFTTDQSVMAVIDRIVAPLGRRIDESSPMVDARLADGSRVNAVIPPLALRGPTITIRKFSKKRLTVEDLMRFEAINKPMIDFLQVAVNQRKSIIVSGGTGSGKTTFLNVLSNCIPNEERIVSIEDAAELRLNQPNLVSLEARPSNLEGKGEVTIRDLVRNSLRMRPDRIIVGECRGKEALDMLQAMNTGHDGSLTTVHANSPRDALARVEVMTMMAGMEMPISAIREQIASGIHIIVQQTRFACGSRKVTYISEITGVESGKILLQDIFRYRQRGYGPDGKVTGEFVATGAIPEFYEDLAARGIETDLSIFRTDKAR